MFVPPNKLCCLPYKRRRGFKSPPPVAYYDLLPPPIWLASLILLPWYFWLASIELLPSVIWLAFINLLPSSSWLAFHFLLPFVFWLASFALLPHITWLAHRQTVVLPIPMTPVMLTTIFWLKPSNFGYGTDSPARAYTGN